MIRTVWFGLALVAIANLGIDARLRAEEPGERECEVVTTQTPTRVLYLGDSITAGGGYIALRDAETFSRNAIPSTINCGLPSETISGLSEVGHADGRFPRPDLFERLDRVMKQTKPTHVYACYGINCGIYEPFDAERFDKYKTGWERLQEKMNIYNAKLTIITPPFYDDLKAPKKGFSYNDVLGRYSKWLVKQRERGWDVIDLHTSMTDAILQERKKNPEFSVQPDGVHPNAAGHWLIAQCLKTHKLDKPSPDQISSGLKFFSQREPGSDPATFRRLVGCDPEVYKLAQQRMAILRDAYVAAAGHKRPGVAKGLPIDEATKKADELTAKIRELVDK
jgi:lysophospholipase L1-like esterase